MPVNNVLESYYITTDFDLISAEPFDQLHMELCSVLCAVHYCQLEDGGWSGRYELDSESESATDDITQFIEVLMHLSKPAQAQMEKCIKRDFNIGVNCGDTWDYSVALTQQTVAKVAQLVGSISYTVYPLRRPDGTPMDN